MSGKIYTVEENAWFYMIQRCYNPNVKIYPYYGGRGITVCDRWRNSQATFVKDMGPKPSLKHSLDRIDSSGNYEPSNCRWATKLEQVTNRRMLRNNKSGVTGVSKSWRQGKWRARVTVDGKHLHLGSFDTIEEAHKAVREYAL